MKMSKKGQCGRMLAIIIALLPITGRSQPAPPSLPSGELLDLWEFSGTNYLSLLRRSAPTMITNVALVPTWAGNGLQVDDTSAARITYPVVEPNGKTNLTCAEGTVEMWFSPDWNSADGIGNWGTVLEVGTWNTNLSAATGAWGLYISPDASSIFFSSQTNGVMTNYVSAPISWSAGDWHHIALTYSASNSALYLEGALITNGPGMTVLPAASVLSNGFSIGSDGNGTGLLQIRGMFNNLITYNFQLSSDTISNNYANDSQMVSALPSSGGRFTHDTESTGPPSPGDGSDGGGGYSPDFYTPTYSSNSFYLQVLPLGTNSYNTNTNGLTIILHGTTPYTQYQLWSTTNLQGTNTVWTLEQTLVASAITNFTATAISMTGRSTLFFKATNFSLDTDNVGLPDWWQMQNFGYVGVDPYGDPAGDGWSNLQKYQMGVSPGTFVAPAPSTGFKVSLNTNGNIILSWPTAANLPSGGAGAVVGYTIHEDGPFDSTRTIMVASNVFSYELPFNDDAGLVDYILAPPDIAFDPVPVFSFQIRYSNANSQWITNQLPFDSHNALTAAIVRGSGGKLYIAASSVPSTVTAIRVTFYESYEQYSINSYGGMAPAYSFMPSVGSTNPVWKVPYFDIPISNFSNGICEIPVAQLPLFGCYTLNLMAFGSNGAVGNAIAASQPTNDWGFWEPLYLAGYDSLNVPFMDGRTNIAQNISFQLRGAGAFEPFNLGLFNSSGGQIYQFQGHTNYVYSGFCFSDEGRVFDGFGNFSDLTLLLQRNEFEPFEENTIFTNLIFNPNLFDSSGNFNAQLDVGAFGGDVDEAELYSLPSLFQTYDYVTSHPAYPPSAIPAMLNPTAADWICSSEALTDSFLISNVDGSMTFPAGSENIYGLPYLHIKYFGDDSSFDVASPGDTFQLGEGTYFFFQEVEAPTLSTINYYFGRPRLDTLPGQSGFAVTNNTYSPFIVPFAVPFSITAWAKQSVVNGHSGMYAYPQQYFDKAFLADTNGNITTNETGILSEYGDFFPVQPGKVFLTTKADGATGSIGSNAVHVIKLQLDVNHDGIMDLSFGGPDNTSSNRPSVFWVNNNYDRWHPVDGSDSEQDDLLTAAGPTTPGFAMSDGNYHILYLNNPIRVIPCTRDLEDFSRLWVCGVDSNLLASLPAGSTVSLNWGDIGSPNLNNPEIDLFMAADPDGGIGYLTNTNIAAQQTNFTQCLYVGRVMPGQNLQLNTNRFTNNWAGNHFIWCGVTTGSGALNLTIADAHSNVLARTTAYINIQDIKQMYERWTVGDNSQIAPTNVAHLAGEELPPMVAPYQYAYDSATDTNMPYILHVHGSNMKLWEKDRFAEAMYKRLYWQGYQGRFGSFRWPSQGGFAGTLTDVTIRAAYFDREEFTAWNSALGLKALLADLNSQYPGQVRLSSHSMGNVAAQEALKQSTNGPVVSVYAPFQGAVASHSYNASAPTRSLGIFDKGDPDTYGHYYTSNSPSYFYGVGGAVKYINFFNTNDYVLQIWNTGQNIKPDPTRYSYAGGEYYRDATVLLSFPEDTYELFSFCVQARCYCIGEEANVGAVFAGTNNVDLHSAPYNFGDAHKGHSAQFRSDSETRWPFYSQLMISFGLKQTQ